MFQELDVSYCTWVEPACMLPLSKMPCLHTLLMRECPKLTEFVAYASLATRYGFKKLKVNCCYLHSISIVSNGSCFFNRRQMRKTNKTPWTSVCVFVCVCVDVITFEVILW